MFAYIVVCLVFFPQWIVWHISSVCVLSLPANALCLTTQSVQSVSTYANIFASVGSGECVLAHFLACVYWTVSELETPFIRRPFAFGESANMNEMNICPGLCAAGSLHHSLAYWLSRVSEWVSEWVGEWVSEWMSARVVGWELQSVNERVSECVT